MCFLQHLLDISSCVALARPLVKCCCQRLAAFFDLEQKLAKFQPPQAAPATTPSSSHSLKSHQDPPPTEDDSVFESTLAAIKREPNIKTEPGTRQSHAQETKSSSSVRKSSSSKDRKHTAATPSSALGDGEVPIITLKAEEGVSSSNPPGGPGGMSSSYFHWCAHHQALMLQLCSIIQTVAIRCPTAFIQTKVFIGRMVSARDSSKATTPLSLLPMGLTELPMPRTLGVELQKKV